LSHEIDYLNWLFGACRAVTAVGGKFSRLGIESDDAFSLLMKYEKCPAVALQLNYLDRGGRRQIVVNTDRATYAVELYRGIWEEDRRRAAVAAGRNDSYRREHLDVMRKGAGLACSQAEALGVLKVIEAAEKASRTKQWIRI